MVNTRISYALFPSEYWQQIVSDTRQFLEDIKNVLGLKNGINTAGERERTFPDGYTFISQMYFLRIDVNYFHEEMLEGYRLSLGRKRPKGFR